MGNLKGLKITNFTRLDYNKFSQTGEFVPGGGTALSVFRAVRLRVEVQPAENLAIDDVWFNTEDCEEGDYGCYDVYEAENETGVGYYSICHNDLTISGYQGLLGYTWWLTETQTADTDFGSGPHDRAHYNNPLYKTEYHPVSPPAQLDETDFDIAKAYGHEINNLPIMPYALPGGWMMTSAGYDDEFEAWDGQPAGAANRHYRIFSQGNTLDYGHQDVAAWLAVTGNYPNDLTTSNATIEQLSNSNYMDVDGGPQGIWTDALSDPQLSYVDPLLTAEKMWNKHVSHVVMFDTLGTDDFGKGLPGNAVDVFVVFKNPLITGDWDFNPSLSDYNPPFSDPTVTGIIFNKIIASGADQDWSNTPYDGGPLNFDPNVLISVDIDGAPQWSYKLGHEPNWDPQGMPAPPVNDTSIEITTENNEIISRGVNVGIVPRPGFNKIEKIPTIKDIADGRYGDDIIISKIAGKTVEGKWTRFGILKVSVEVTEDSDGKDVVSKYISKVPTLKTKNNDNIKLEVGKKEKINGKIWCYYMNVLCKSTSSLKKIKAEVVVETRDYPTTRTRDLEIHSIRTTSNTTIDHTGGFVDIVIKGVPGSDFGFVFNESSYADDQWSFGVSESSGNPNHFKQSIYHTDDVSILPNTGKTTTFYGKDITVITGQIGGSGTYTHRQLIPEITTFRTKVNEHSGIDRRDIVLDNITTDVKVGDYVFNYTKKQPIGRVREFNNTTLTGTDPFKASDVTDNTPLRFDRARVYTTHLIEDLCSKISRYARGDDDLGEPMRVVFYQAQKRIITLAHTIAGSNYKVLNYNTEATGLGHGDEHYTYIDNIRSRSYKVELELELQNGSHRWATFLPAAQIDYYSFFSNMDSRQTGGYGVQILSMSSSALNASNAKVKLTYELLITSVPKKSDVLPTGMREFTLTCNLDNVYTITT